MYVNTNYILLNYFTTEPDFVSSMEDKDYVYFFFRESAVEYINCGKVIKTHELILSLSSNMNYRLYAKCLTDS